MKKSLTITLSIMVAAAFTACSNEPITIKAATQLEGENLQASRTIVSRQTANGDGSVSVTPTNVTGQVASVGLMIGESDGFNVFLMIADAYATSGFHEDFVVPGADYLFDFDLADPKLEAIDFIVGENDIYPADADAYTSRIEATFAYMDFDFVITDTSLNSEGPYTIRLILADQDTDKNGTIEATEPHKGDLLLKDGGVFKWVNSDPGEANYLSATRPSSVIKHVQSDEFEGWGEGEIGGVIPSVMANIDTLDRQQITREEFMSSTWQFDVIFDMKDSLTFDPAGINPPQNVLTDIDNTRKLVDAFDINLFPNTGEPGFGAWIDATATAAR